jgi:hypothetical protein
MVLRRPGAAARIVLIALACALLPAAVVSGQESGAQPSSARSAWSRFLGARQYEYDERLDLALDGSAVVDINASLAALVALHGATLDIDPEARLDQGAVRALFQGPGAVMRELSAFRRHGRRFVHVRLVVNDIRQVSGIVPLAWSRYRLDRLNEEYHFMQDVGPPRAGHPVSAGWTGEELVAFRVHLPSKINFHNSPDEVERGNILAWEQRLTDRLAGVPLHMEARMQTQSILYRTLWLFGGTFGAALATMGVMVWWIRRKGNVAERAPVSFTG